MVLFISRVSWLSALLQASACVTLHFCASASRTLWQRVMVLRRAHNPAEGRIKLEAIIRPSGITKIKIARHPTGRQPLPNICPWGYREKKSLPEYTQSVLRDINIWALARWFELGYWATILKCSGPQKVPRQKQALNWCHWSTKKHDPPLRAVVLCNPVLLGSPGCQRADIISSAQSASNLVIRPNWRSIVPLTVDNHRFISFLNLCLCHCLSAFPAWRSLRLITGKDPINKLSSHKTV